MSDAFELLSFDFVEDSAKTRFVKDVKLPATNRVEILHLNGAVATVGKDNTANINPVVDGKNITIYADKATIDASGKKTLDVTVDTGVAYEFPEDYVEASGVFKKVAGESTKLNIVMSSDDTEKTIALKAGTETLEVTVKVEDIAAPTFVSARKAENTSDKAFTDNMTAVIDSEFVGVGDGGVTFDASAKTITVKANVNAMKAYDRTVDGKTVNGKWIAVLVKTNNKVADLVNDTDAKYGATDEEVIYWIDAQTAIEAAQKLVLKNKNTGDVDAKTELTITVEDTSNVTLSAVTISDKDTKPAELSANVVADFTANQEKAEVSNNGNTIKVEAKLLDMKSYLKEGETKAWLAIDVAYNDGEDKTKLVWLEAKEGKTTIKIEIKDEDGNVTETLEMPVEIVDVSEPRVVSVEVTNGKNTTAKFTENTNNITVESNINALETSKRTVTVDGEATEVTGKWIALSVDTGMADWKLAKAADDKTEIESDGTVVKAGSKMTVWVNASEETTKKVYVTRDNNESAVTFNISLTDTSVMELQSITKITTPEATAVENLMNEEAYAKFVNNVNCVTVANNAVSVDLLAMQEYSYDGKVSAAKWFPLLVNANVTKEELVSAGYGISSSINSSTFGADDVDQLLVWIDADKLVKTEDGIKTTITLKNNAGETYSFDIDVTDTSVMKLVSATLAKADKDDIALSDTNKAATRYLSNMNYVKFKDDSVNKETNTIKVYVDTNKVLPYTLAGVEKNWVALVLDLNATTYVDGLYKVMTDDDGALDTDNWVTAETPTGKEIVVWFDAKVGGEMSLKSTQTIGGEEVTEELPFNIVIVHEDMEAVEEA